MINKPTVPPYRARFNQRTNEVVCILKSISRLKAVSIFNISGFRIHELLISFTVKTESKANNYMKKVEDKLFDFIDSKKELEITTKAGITVRAPDDYSLEAEATLVEREDAVLSVNFYSSKKDFVIALQIKKIEDIHNLTPGSLMELYHIGFAEIVCVVTIQCIYCMSFKKLGSVIVAENDSAVKMNIPETTVLETPDQFITYSREYYRLYESCQI